MPFQKEGPSLPRLPSGSSSIYKTNLASSVLLPSHAERGGARGSKPPYTTSTEGAAFFSPPSQSEECGEEVRRVLNGPGCLQRKNSGIEWNRLRFPPWINPPQHAKS